MQNGVIDGRASMILVERRSVANQNILAGG
jgi:hypothetical protein